ncbi:hypothetical protein [Pedobacter sp. SYP-B3415]|uniref:hypothetical protein n=1 Tax=Pedobacter sp. SYP-B3415 TaxID=2496641 RepID=UPI00101DB5A2|nr:hypothetical protein [Pedobacter sp. SYP-B3415]
MKKIITGLALVLCISYSQGQTKAKSQKKQAKSACSTDLKSQKSCCMKKPARFGVAKATAKPQVPAKKS